MTCMKGGKGFKHDPRLDQSAFVFFRCSAQTRYHDPHRWPGVVESISMSDVSMCVHVPAYACVDGRKLFVY